MKSVLISIQPKWCELIADEVSFVGSKTDSNDTYMPSAYAPRPEEEAKMDGLPFYQ